MGGRGCVGAFLIDGVEVDEYVVVAGYLLAQDAQMLLG